jgi:4-amino-4-deoxy-L-arabinose transferase-like glycosyltransferase
VCVSPDADSYLWLATAVGAQSAAGYQLATGEPVMSLGGFNGSDPYPTLVEFNVMVEAGEVHYFIAGGKSGPGGTGGPGGSASSAMSAITAWVQSTYTATTVGGVTVYDLSGGATSA